MIPDWLNLNVAAAIALLSGAAAAYRAHVHGRRDIDALAQRVQALEQSTAAADLVESLRTECKRELDGEIAVVSTKLDALKAVDGGLQADMRDVKKTLSELWATASRIDKNLAALAAKLESR